MLEKLGILTAIIFVVIGLVLWCAYRFLAKNRQNHKAKKSKDLSDESQDDLKGLIDGIENNDFIEDTSEVSVTLCVK